MSTITNAQRKQGFFYEMFKKVHCLGFFFFTIGELSVNRRSTVTTIVTQHYITNQEERCDMKARHPALWPNPMRVQ